MIDLYLTTWKAPPGDLWIAGTEAGVMRVGFGPLPTDDDPAGLASAGVLDVHHHPGPLRPVIASLRDYFAGNVPEPRATLVLPTTLTTFGTRVLDAVRTIPAGRVWTYDDIAREAGSPRAARAVGRVLALNPIPIFIPCHRVLTKRGEIAGYQGGTGWKRALLDLESRQIRLATRKRRRRAARD